MILTSIEDLFSFKLEIFFQIFERSPTFFSISSLSKNSVRSLNASSSIPWATQIKILDGYQ